MKTISHPQFHFHKNLIKLNYKRKAFHKLKFSKRKSSKRFILIKKKLILNHLILIRVIKHPSSLFQIIYSYPYSVTYNILIEKSTCFTSIKITQYSKPHISCIKV